MTIVCALVVAFWNAGRAAAERAKALGRDACRIANVQWLDESVHAVALRPYRRADGWLGLERTFRFHYSRDGVERHVGTLVLRGDRMVAFSGPVTPSPTSLH